MSYVLFFSSVSSRLFQRAQYFRSFFSFVFIYQLRQDYARGGLFSIPQISMASPYPLSPISQVPALDPLTRHVQQMACAGCLLTQSCLYRSVVDGKAQRSSREMGLMAYLAAGRARD
jgi:hypothetical protein